MCDALAALARDLADAGANVPPAHLQSGTEHVEVLLDRPTMPPAAGWHAETDGAVDTIDPASEDEQRMTAAPLLVTLGQPDESGEGLLDLKATVVTTLTGDDVWRSAWQRLEAAIG